MFQCTINQMADRIAKEIGDRKHFDAIKKALDDFWSDKIADVWTTDDVLDDFPKLTRLDAIDVLLHVHRKFDATRGINFAVIETAVHVLFPDKTDKACNLEDL